MNLEEKIKNIINVLRKTVLLREEKEKIRLHLIDFIKQNPLPNKFVYPKVYFGFNAPFFKYAFVALAITLFSGAGIALASQNSLPGDFLYPIKTGANEKIVKLFLFSDEAKARHNLRLAQLRLEETESMAVGNLLDDPKIAKIKVLLDNHVADTKKIIVRINGQKKANVAVELNSELESLFNSHEKILINLSGNIKNKKSNDIVENMALAIKEKSEEAVRERHNDELNLHENSSPRIKIAAENKLQEVNHKMEGVSAFIENEKDTMTPGAYARAISDLQISKNIIIEGEQALALEKYDVAFITFQKAMRTLQEIKVYAATEEKLKIQIDNRRGNDDEDDNINIRIKL